MGFSLKGYQIKAIIRMKNGCILCGGVGSGKSLTAIGYYYLQNGGSMEFLSGNGYSPMRKDAARLYIITTAKKRDSCEWDGELSRFLISKNDVVVDSWNNIKRYSSVTDAFFILDEQRLVGNGAWVKSFYKIAKNNQWILLSATPGDTFVDYIPVFVANGFYRNRTDFIKQHVIYSQYAKFPKVEGYVNTGKINYLRNKVLVPMEFERKTEQHHMDVWCDYDVQAYKNLIKTRWDPWKNEPFQNAGGLCYAMRKMVNSDESRSVALLEIYESHPKLIIFYNFDYELEILHSIFDALVGVDDFKIGEWNGHNHQSVPNSSHWVYFVQYTAGAEGWNCVTTDTIVFWSQNYSYKTLIQSCGRIDRLNTAYTDLYYYHLKSRSSIDTAISKAISSKKKFNERAFINW